jgi:7-cyano-7-deazaguanine synthase
MQIDNVMLYSGGLDSTVLLYKLKPNVKALLVNYNQRHKKELLYATLTCRNLGVEYEAVNLSAINHLIASGSQAGLAPVPEGHYASESMKATVVPNRNMIMLSIAVGHAITIGARNVYFAAHAGDHAIYPDCRPSFVNALNHAV